MKKRMLGGLLAALAFMPSLASAQVLILRGKTTSKVTAKVVAPNNLTVTDDKGGWFEKGLEMRQFGGWETAYEVEARLRITSSSGKFQVRMDQPLAITNQAKPAQAFRTPTVRMGAEGQDLKLLGVKAVEFQNPKPAVPNADSKGDYNLAVAAYPPAGDFKSTAGIYTGTLSLVFEPVVTK